MVLSPDLPARCLKAFRAAFAATVGRPLLAEYELETPISITERAVGGWALHASYMAANEAEAVEAAANLGKRKANAVNNGRELTQETIGYATNWELAVDFEPMSERIKVSHRGAVVLASQCPAIVKEREDLAKLQAAELPPLELKDPSKDPSKPAEVKGKGGKR